MEYLVLDEDAPLQEGVRKAHVLVDKGTGKFPFDEQIERIQKIINESQ
jgi:hypothetical protein